MLSHEELMTIASEFENILDGNIKANECDEMTQNFLMVYTYLLARTVKRHDDPKAAFLSLPDEWKPDVKTVLQRMKSS